MPFSFPTPGLPVSGELQFKDGKRTLPEYLMVLMASVDTPRYTYQEAIAVVNRGLAGRHVSAAYDALLTEHFSDDPR